MMRTAFLGVALACLAGGCGQKLNVEKTFEATHMGTDFTVQPVRKTQTIKVDATASGGKIDVYVFLESARDVAEKAILAKRIDATVLAHSEKADSVSLKAEIPAGQTAMVQVRASTLVKSQVKLKITN